MKNVMRSLCALLCVMMIVSFISAVSAAEPMALEYSFDAKDYGGTVSGYWFSDLTTRVDGFVIPEYKNSGGLLEYFGSTKATYSNWMAGWNGGYATHDLSLTGNEFVAYKIRVPAADTYNVTFEQPSSGKGGKFNLYIIPAADDIKVAKDLLSYISDTETLAISGIEIGDWSTTIYNGSFTAETAGEYYAVWRRIGSSASNNANYVRIKKLTLTATTAEGTAPIWADVSLESTAALDVASAASTKAVVNKVYMSDATEAETLPEITFESSDSYIASVSAAGTVTAKCAGSAKVRAVTTLSDGSKYILGETVVNVIDTSLCGVNAEYSFTQADYPETDDASGITYETSGGRLAYNSIVTGATKNFYIWSKAYACHSLTRPALGKWAYAIYKIRIPKAGAYKLTYDYFSMLNSATKVSVFILPKDTDIENMNSVLKEESPIFASISNAEKDGKIVSSSARFVAEEAGEQLLVFGVMNDMNASFVRPAKITLSGGESATAGIVGEIAADKNELAVGESATLTAKAYNAVDGSVVSGVTLSTKSDVVEISGNSITAKKAGKAVIEATAEGYPNTIEYEITVKAPVETAAAKVSFSADSVIDGEMVKVNGTEYDDYVASLARGTEITVSAPEVEGYKFVGWKRGSNENGAYVESNSSYSFSLMTNTYLTAVYDKSDDSEKKVEFWNENGNFVASATESEYNAMTSLPKASRIGFVFDMWKTDEETEFTTGMTLAEGTTRAVATYKSSGSEFTVTGLGAGEYSYDDKLSLSESSAGIWSRGGKAVAYGTDYTYYVWDNTEISFSAGGENKPMVNLEYSETHKAYMLEYYGENVVEAGILFSASGKPTVSSCAEKFTSQRKLTHGQFTAKSDYANARGYIICLVDGEYIVTYTD